MIPRVALARWLADRDAQKHSQAKVDEAARRWGAAPLIARLDRDVAEANPRTAETLIAAARRFFDRSDDIAAMMRALIAESRADPFFRPPFHPLASEVQNSLLLYHHPDLSVSLGVTGVDMLAAKRVGRSGAASINFTGFATLLRFVRAGNAALSLWEAPTIEENFSQAQAGSCRLAGRRRISDGEDVLIDGRYQSFVIDHAEGDIVFLQAVARAGCAPLGTEYDSGALRCIGASSTDETSSRLQMMMSLLRALGRYDAFPLFEEALASPQFYLRWHVMREMLTLDAEAALPSLRRMAAKDPHPDVRAAARRTLELFFAPEQGPPAEGEVACRA